ncbi:hypothetical protein Tco_1179886 [Tanacetum coccineum]
MNPITAQQVALDNALVTPEKRLKIEKCNPRIEFNKPQRETTYQVTLDKIKDTDAYRFKLDKQKFRIDTEVFCEILQICPRLPNQDFIEPPFEEEMVPFIKELGYTSKCDMLSEIHTDHMHQPWRTFVAVINRCISRKSTSLDSLRPSRAQILWGMFYKKNVDFVALLNKINLHTIQDDSLLGILKYVSKTEDYHKYGALIHKQIINQAIKDSKEYKIYLAYATGTATPKKERKFKKPASPSKKQTLEDVSSKKPSRKKSTGVQIKDILDVSMLKKKALATTDRSKGIDLLSEAALLEDAQLKKALKRSKRDTTIKQNKFWGDSGDEENEQGDDESNEQSDDDHEQADDERTEYDDDEEETQDDEFVHTPDDYVPIDNETNDEL